ncbi:BAG family molecular chaperone regulator 6-like [Vicia villosa]|uniref:BAG family molecular chaperone regulator 6-like n=1 Tax=Vicia villosa TaxID=3911 RepID=UPI00273BCCDF|nr:BAG family molecular chaperone regulator 6-like [Vicia villosa]
MTDKTEPCSPIQVSQTKTDENMAANTAIHEDGKEERRVLLDADAAVVIQTAYHGYLVRKSQPLKKLRQIAEVSKEVTNVKDRIEAFGDSSNLQIDDKEKVAIGETIRRLLLKLDTIQVCESEIANKFHYLVYYK